MPFTAIAFVLFGKKEGRKKWGEREESGGSEGGRNGGKEERKLREKCP